MTKTVISTAKLGHTFQVGESVVHALDQIDLEVEVGDYVAVMGPSGSGKTTLMNILGCLDRPDSGEYRLLDQAVSSMDDTQLSSLRNRHIGFVFQSFHLLPRMTALENVLVPIRYADDWAEEGLRRGPALLERLGLAQRKDHRRTNYPAASASVWRSPGPWWRMRRFSWPMNQPEPRFQNRRGDDVAVRRTQSRRPDHPDGYPRRRGRVPRDPVAALQTE